MFKIRDIHRLLRAILVFLFLSMTFQGCGSGLSRVSDTDQPDISDEVSPHQDESFYYPPLDSSDWQKSSPKSLGWNTQKLNELYQFLEDNLTTGFLVLHKGKIVDERYWQGWGPDTSSRVFSVTKSLTSAVVGLLIEEKSLDLDDSIEQHLDLSNLSPSQRDEYKKVLIRNLLSMNSGLNEALNIETPPGQKWFYNTPAYYRLIEIIENASSLSDNRQDLFEELLFRKIGISNSQFTNQGTGNVLSMSVRDMARFGLFVLGKGRWENENFYGSTDYLSSALSSSQKQNLAYGFLFWLNGTRNCMSPRNGQQVIQGSLIPSAPNDLIAALGKGDKKIYVVPSLDLVVIRHGESAGLEQLADSSFDADFWELMSEVLNID